MSAISASVGSRGVAATGGVKRVGLGCAEDEVGLEDCEGVLTGRKTSPGRKSDGSSISGSLISGSLSDTSSIRGLDIVVVED